jgi:hypothetical protein
MAIFSGDKREGGEHPRRRATDQMPLSIVAHDLTVTGDLVAEGVVKVEGRVKGNIRAGNQILIAPGATIEGDLHTKEAVIGGEVRASSTPATGWSCRPPRSWKATSTRRASPFSKAPGSRAR